MGTLHFITGDIIENSKNMDAIVNAQNKYMQYGSGVCGAIYKAAGQKLEKYCLDNYKECMIDGEVRITPGFNLNCDIIHVLAPKAYEHQNPLEPLIKCYENLLKEIKKHNYKKVITPSLGAGIHGYEHDTIAKPLVAILNEFCQNNDVDLYFINLNTMYTEFYLKEYILAKNLNLKKDLLNLSNEEIKEYLCVNGLINNDAKFLYDDFIDGKDILEMNLTEKIILLQYTIENFNLSSEYLIPLIKEM